MVPSVIQQFVFHLHQKIKPIMALVCESLPPICLGFMFDMLDICQYLLDETVIAVGPFYLVSMPGEVKYPTSPHRNFLCSLNPQKCVYAAEKAVLH